MEALIRTKQADLGLGGRNFCNRAVEFLQQQKQPVQKFFKERIEQIPATFC